MKKLIRFFVVMLFLLGCMAPATFATDTSGIELSDCSDIRVYTRVKASHILVNSQELAAKIKKEITAGKSFAQAAREYSACPSKDEGGDLGYFCRGMMVPEFEQAAFVLPVGRLSDPVETQFGWHLILVTDKK